MLAYISGDDVFVGDIKVTANNLLSDGCLCTDRLYVSFIVSVGELYRRPSAITFYIKLMQPFILVN